MKTVYFWRFKNKIMNTGKGYTKKKDNVERVYIPETGRLQPQALEIEKVVLGALMLERDAYLTISDILRPECFYDPKHALIFKAIVELTRYGRPVDMLTVVEQLKKNGNLKDAGDMLYISELTENVAGTTHLEYHAKIIVQKFLSRELINFSGLIQGKAYDESNDIEELMQEAEGKLFEISQRNIKKDAVQINPVITAAINTIQKAYQQKEGLSGLSSGFTKLDMITHGWQKSDLIVIAARPAMGKTAFVLSMAKNMAVNFKIPVAIFSLEMSNLQLVNRLIANVCELTGEKIKSGRLEPYEWDQLDYKITELYDAPIYIDDTPSLSVFELRTKARRLVREHNIECIIIDYLQLMNASGMTFNSREQEVSTISHSLKGLAKELNIPVIALSQLNRGVESREGKRPQLSDLRESGSIEQDADMVCFLHRPEVYGIKEDANHNDLTGLAEVIVAKHRNGANGELWLTFRNAYIRFENPNESGIKNEYTSKINTVHEKTNTKKPSVSYQADFVVQPSDELSPF